MTKENIESGNQGWENKPQNPFIAYLQKIRLAAGGVSENENFDSLFGDYLKLQEKHLEQFYQSETKPLIESMFEGIRIRRMMVQLVNYWEENRRVKELKHPGYDKNVVNLFWDLRSWYFDGLQCRSVEGRTNREYEALRINPLLLINLYGVKEEELNEITPEKVDYWRKKMRDIGRTKKPEAILRNEIKFIETYVEQYENFFQEQHDFFYELDFHTYRLKHCNSTTPGSERRDIFDGVLHELYGFDPRKREKKIKNEISSTGKEKLSDEYEGQTLKQVRIIKEGKLCEIAYYVLHPPKKRQDF